MPDVAADASESSNLPVALEGKLVAMLNKEVDSGAPAVGGNCNGLAALILVAEILPSASTG
ncbi:MAG: hypothetical protein RQ783_10170, partial [Gammaproteobacteria bacterium]|nr:hypothetical protein [Gammaproteobacteria bacterium]